MEGSEGKHNVGEKIGQESDCWRGECREMRSEVCSTQHIAPSFLATPKNRKVQVSCLPGPLASTGSLTCARGLFNVDDGCCSSCPS